ncbi:MAG: hypothetical protein SPJ59_06555 [Peptoniphilaceae bacterium]|nr:hypothetical protein [Peptoniphilaceae bacterium]MDY5842561.1 hypothetical protein [Peptoniphilaceae bacterium]MDY6146933.1 hypothetical protein [Peptoniphilaceae bacterium]
MLSPDGIARLDELKKKLLECTNHRENYADEIFRLREQKEAAAQDDVKRQETLTRIKDLKSFIEKQDVKLTKFDETLSSQLIKKSPSLMITSPWR